MVGSGNITNRPLSANHMFKLFQDQHDEEFILGLDDALATDGNEKPKTEEEDDDRDNESKCRADPAAHIVLPGAAVILQPVLRDGAWTAGGDLTLGTVKTGGTVVSLSKRPERAAVAVVAVAAAAVVVVDEAVVVPAILEAGTAVEVDGQKKRADEQEGRNGVVSQAMVFAKTEAKTTCTETDPTCAVAVPTCTNADPMCVEADPTFTETDPTFTDADPTRTEADPTFTDADPTRTEADPTCEEADPTCEEADPTCTNADATCAEADPICAEADTTSVKADRTSEPHLEDEDHQTEGTGTVVSAAVRTDTPGAAPALTSLKIYIKTDAVDSILS